MNRWFNPLLHFLGIALFLSLPFLVNPAWWNGHDSPFSGFALKDFWVFFLMVLHFYLAYLVLIPRLLFPKRRWLFILMVLLSLLAFGLLEETSDWIFPQEGRHSHNHRKDQGERMEFPWFFLVFMYIRHNIIPFILSFFLAMILRLANRWREVEKERISTELAYLKSQINPHFLFNSLNSIYSLALEKSDQTPAAIVKLSGMMRYVLTEARQDHVPVEKELEYISDYIALQRLRFGETLRLDYRLEGTFGQAVISPLLLIPVIENAFKYGVNPEKNPEIVIRIALQKGTISLDVTNTIVQDKNPFGEKSGLGLKNLRHRLQLLYPGRHVLQVETDGQTFHVHLAIQIE